MLSNIPEQQAEDSLSEDDIGEELKASITNNEAQSARAKVTQTSTSECRAINCLASNALGLLVTLVHSNLSRKAFSLDVCWLGKICHADKPLLAGLQQGQCQIVYKTTLLLCIAKWPHGCSTQTLFLIMKSGAGLMVRWRSVCSSSSLTMYVLRHWYGSLDQD